MYRCVNRGEVVVLGSGFAGSLMARVLAVLGVGAYRSAFEQPAAVMGRQTERLHDSAVWVLPNPSGLNANYQLPDLIRLFRELHDWVNV